MVDQRATTTTTSSTRMTAYPRGARLLLFGAAIALAAIQGGSADRGRQCVPRDFGFGSFACVCNATYCDELPRVTPGSSRTAQLFVSTKQGHRLTRLEVPFWASADPADGSQELTVNRNKTFQTVAGFGGAFTDAAGINILSLPEEAQDLLLRSYYSEEGLEYNMARVPIGGTDFSTRIYTYDDTTSDRSLDNFQLAPEDLTYKIPLIQRALETRRPAADEVQLFASSWSPPTWMKTSKKIAGFSRLKEEFYQAYADYHVKFLDAYEAHNLTFYCISTGNEPLNGIIPFKHFNSLGWTPSGMHKWIKENFGPTIRSSKYKDVRIMAHDDQRILLPWELKMILADKATEDFIDIIGYHWYLNFITPSSILDSLHKSYPNKLIISSEACNGDKPWDFTRVQPGSWKRGELYLTDIVEVMNHWTSAWIDWNIALDMQGGPTWAKNNVDSPIVIDAEKKEFYRNPTFYALAHITKFVPRGSVRVDLKSKGGPWLTGKLKHIAFKRPDNGLVVILINTHSSSRNVIITEEGRGQLTFTVAANSFATVIYW